VRGDPHRISTAPRYDSDAHGRWDLADDEQPLARSRHRSGKHPVRQHRSIVPLYLISPPPLTAPQIFISVRRYVYPYDRGSINLGADDGDVWNVRLDPPSFVSPACPPALPLMDCQVYDRNWNADRAAHLCDGMVLPRRADREYPHVNTADRSASRRGIADDRDRGGALPPRRYSVDGSLYRRSSHCLDMKSSKMLNHVRSGSESSHSA